MVFRTLMASEVDAWADLCDAAFPETPRQYFVDHYWFDPAADPRNTLVAVEGGRIAASVRMVPRRMYLKGRAVDICGIGDVATHPDFRRRGLSAELLRRAIARMEEAKQPVAQLFTGVWPHYEKHGWQRVAQRRVRCAVPHAPLPSGMELRPYTAEDAPMVRALYDLYAPRFDGVLVRDTPAYWDQWIDRLSSPRHVLVKDGEIRACVTVYYKHGSDRFEVSEFTAVPECEHLLPEMAGELMQRLGLPSTMDLPHAFWPAARGEAIPDEGMMLRLNMPLTLDRKYTTTEDLIASLGEALFFGADGY